jgi:hypothetical protein
VLPEIPSSWAWRTSWIRARSGTHPTAPARLQQTSAYKATDVLAEKRASCQWSPADEDKHHKPWSAKGQPAQMHVRGAKATRDFQDLATRVSCLRHPALLRKRNHLSPGRMARLPHGNLPDQTVPSALRSKPTALETSKIAIRRSLQQTLLRSPRKPDCQCRLPSMKVIRTPWTLCAKSLKHISRHRISLLARDHGRLRQLKFQPWATWIASRKHHANQSTRQSTRHPWQRLR